MATVHVLGGGPSALAAAYDLATKDPARQIVVYAAGWRLGGKCASGMGIDGRRNEEHGLHMPLGFYENFFAQIRAIYGILARPVDDPLRTWTDAFKPRSEVILRQEVDGQWFDWPIMFEDRTRGAWTPGDMANACENGQPFPHVSLADVAKRILNRVVEHTRAHAPARSANVVISAMVHSDALEHVTSLVAFFTQHPDAATSFEILKAKVYSELGAAGAAGLLALHNAGRSLSDIDDLDFLEWLDEHSVTGALSDDVRVSAPIKMAYELVFAYRNGDPAQASLAAGVAARGIIRMLFGYQGAFGYDLAAGMGETVITPYYQALSRLPNVTFRFFARVVDVHLQGGRVASFDVLRQATTNGAAPYDPFAPGTRQWPSRPLYDQLFEGNQLQQTQELPDGGYDLESSYSAWSGVGNAQTVAVAAGDAVVLAIPAPELTAITGELAAQSPAWQAMLDNVTGVGTIATQLWFNDPTTALGWARPAGLQEDPLIGGAMQDPLGNIADTSRMIASEGWPADDRPQGLLYLCGPFPENAPPPAGQPDTAYIVATRTTARQTALEWLETEGAQLFPNLVQPNGRLDKTTLFVPAARRGFVDEFKWQFVNANVGPAHRYITSFPDTIKARLPPDGPGKLGLATNLFLAGDWTDNGFNGGCLEAAVTSGRMAARAVLGGAYELYGQDDDHW